MILYNEDRHNHIMWLLHLQVHHSKYFISFSVKATDGLVTHFSSRIAISNASHISRMPASLYCFVMAQSHRRGKQPHDEQLTLTLLPVPVFSDSRSHAAGHSRIFRTAQSTSDRIGVECRHNFLRALREACGMVHGTRFLFIRRLTIYLATQATELVFC